MVLAVGTASSTSRVSTCCLTLLWTSTTGDAPGDRDDFLQRADGQVDVDGGGEVRGEFEALADAC